MNDENEYIGNDHLDGTTEDSVNEAEESALDALVLRFGADYHRPPDFVPREEMWHEIRQSGVPHRFIGQHPAWSVLAAAVLLLGVGIGIGVEAHSRVVTRTRPVGPTTPEVAVAVPRAPISRRDSNDVVIAPRSPEQPVVQPVVQPRTGDARDTYASNSGGSELNGDARSVAYTLATARHFTAVEALLTSFQTSPHDARGDAQMAAWARALLSQTRLLLDSPAATDPARERLLQDLELVLVQMTQLSPSNTQIDQEMIDGSVRHTDVITRLRTAVPAGGTTHL